MSDIEDIINRVIAAGASLRLTIACDGIENLPSGLLEEIQESRQGVVAHLARQVVPGILTRRRKVRARPKWWSAPDKWDASGPRRGDFCQSCECQTFYRLNGGWACEREFPNFYHLGHNDIHFSVDC